MIRGAIFDVDGTLLNSMHVWDTVGSSYVRKHGLEPSEDLDARVKEFCLRDLSQVMINEYGIEKPIDDIETDLSGMVEDKYFYTIPLKPGVAQLLEALHQRGVKMCVASASRYEHIKRALTRCGVMQYFSEIFSCISVGHSKRENVIYEMALEHLGTKAEETAMFDDALYVAQTAGALGLRCVGIFEETMKHQSELMEATEYYIKDYADIDEFLAWFDGQ